MAKPEYKFGEDRIITKLKTYIDSTYSKHYSSCKIQSTEVIFDAEHGESFCIGNIMKYAQRYGKKDGRNIKDLFKIIHYAIILLGKIAEEEEREYREYLDELQKDSD